MMKERKEKKKKGGKISVFWRVCESEHIKTAVSTCGDVTYGFAADFESYHLCSLECCDKVDSGRASHSNGLASLFPIRNAPGSDLVSGTIKTCCGFPHSLQADFEGSTLFVLELCGYKFFVSPCILIH